MEKEIYKNPETVRFPVGAYMLLWFTNPDLTENEQGGYEQSLCSQFYMSLKEAERMAEFLSGSRIILMCTAQNPADMQNNVYWDAVKVYGESFDLNELTILPEPQKWLQQYFINMEKQKNSIG